MRYAVLSSICGETPTATKPGGFGSFTVIIILVMKRPFLSAGCGLMDTEENLALPVNCDSARLGVALNKPKAMGRAIARHAAVHSRSLRAKFSWRTTRSVMM